MPAAGTVLDREAVLGPFLSAHWRIPLRPQGTPPAEYLEVDSRLDPPICGACHPLQFAQWSTSVHARASSPGLLGQLIEGALAAPADSRMCMSCHAPLGEQQAWGEDLQPNPGLDPGLRAQGLVCAGCHVRAHRRFGPPRRPERPLPPDTTRHGGFEARDEFMQSRFCAECHQFFDDVGINGKPIENTFAEWQASPQAAAGRPCQDCHMPDRAHTWRGIHDAEMVRAAVDVSLMPQEAAAGEVRASLVILNRDVGHAFPTYVTPRVFVALFQVDASGAEIPGSRIDGVIGRDVDLQRGVEIFDTRLLPMEAARLDYALPVASGAAALVGRVTVDPDYFYRGLFETLLETYADAQARDLMEQARLGVEDTRYVLAERRQAIPAAAP